MFVLPGESGRARSRRLRHENPELKILLVTGYAEQLGLLEAEQEDFLAKPFFDCGLAEKGEAVADCGAVRTSFPINRAYQRMHFVHVVFTFEALANESG